MRYILYARKSSESEDRQVQSIEDQLRVLREFAQSRNLLVIEEVTESKSAKAPGNRPDFDRMLHSIDKGKAEAILCWNVNRLTRNPIDSGKLSWLLQNGVLQAIETPDRKYLPSDNVLLLSVETGTANQFILDLKKSVIRGMESKAMRGEFPHRAPEGYRNNPFTRQIEPDPERFPLIERAWRLLIAGTHTPADVIRLLNDWGYRTRGSSKYPSGGLSKTSGYQMFANRFYAGYFSFRGVSYKGIHHAMITLEEYHRVQTRCGSLLGRRKQGKNTFPYAGLIKCGVCGRGITAEVQTGHLKRGRYVYYHCNNSTGQCGKRSIREDVLEARIEECLARITITEEFKEIVLDMLRGWVEQEFGNLEAVQRSMMQAVSEEERRLNELFEMRLTRLISDEQFRNKQAELQSHLEGRRDRLRHIQEQLDRTRAVVRDALEFRLHARDDFLRGNMEKRRQIAASLGVHYVLDKGEIIIEPNPLLSIMMDVEGNTKVNHTFSVIEPAESRSTSQKPSHSSERVLSGTPDGTLHELWYGLFRRIWEGELTFRCL